MEELISRMNNHQSRLLHPIIVFQSRNIPCFFYCLVSVFGEFHRVLYRIIWNNSFEAYHKALKKKTYRKASNIVIYTINHEYHNIHVHEEKKHVHRYRKHERNFPYCFTITWLFPSKNFQCGCSWLIYKYNAITNRKINVRFASQK